jgi:hypothetical protein
MMMHRCTSLRNIQRFLPLVPLLRRRCSTVVPQVNDFSFVHVANHDGMPSLLLKKKKLDSGDIVFKFSGKILSSNTGDRCLQVGQQQWITPKAEEGEPPWVFLNHSFEPSVHLSHPPLSTIEEKSPNVFDVEIEEKVEELEYDSPIVLTVTANFELSKNTPLTIDYTLHEYIMYKDGFICAETGRNVRGFHFLTEEEKIKALPKAANHIKMLHQEALGRFISNMTQ